MLKPLFNAIANRSFSCDVAQLNQIVFYLLETCANLKLKPRELEPACYCKKIQKTLIRTLTLGNRPATPPIQFHAPVSSQHQNY
ncbi:hypothetical protein BRADI_4g11143v3 [Brachypodium distachyon]|uniref:Uncharacterized protein n=1 Tax=Brachypodium distachyon TaxID=15368 RepID=A0A2K2CM26_BRADI|nr:hypothetical protein BRADI_4g11143v3 [Brachypodium distachyon]PNT63080.1 hypothetical protein BRADI_4g11143v3 [Brachypodium distachyon]